MLLGFVNLRMVFLLYNVEKIMKKNFLNVFVVLKYLKVLNFKDIEMMK